MNMLFVEDDVFFRDNYIEYLKRYFDNVYEASTAEEALLIYKANKIDFILADIEMNKMNGIEMIKKIRENDLDTLIVVLSAYDKKEYLLSAIKLNLTDYLIKPVKYNDFIKLIQDISQKLKKSISNSNNIKLVDSISWDVDKEKLYKDSSEIVLTKSEKLFFKLFCKKTVASFTKDQIFEEIYPLEEFNENKIRLLIKRIRAKTLKDIIINQYGQGYIFNFFNKS